MTKSKKVSEDFGAQLEKVPIRGIAVHSGVSRNGILYTPEELKKFAKTLEGVSIIKDHEASVDNAVGVVERTDAINDGEIVHYEGWIKDHKLSEQVKDGRVKHVSIGAMVEKLVKEDEDSDVFIAKGIHGVELSTVVVPGVPGASISQSLEKHEKAKTTNEKLKIPAISEDVSKFTKVSEWKKSKSVKEENIPESKGGKLKMKEEKNINESVPNETDSNVEEEVKRKMTEEKVNELTASLSEKESLLAEKEDKLKEMEAKLVKAEKVQKDALVEKYKKLAQEKKVEVKDVSEVSEESLNLLIEQLESVVVKEEEEPVAEPVAEPATEPATEPETKGEVGDGEAAAEEGLDSNLVAEKANFGRGYSLFRESYDKNKYKRLAR